MLKKIQTIKRQLREKLMIKIYHKFFDYYEDSIAVRGKNLSHFKNKLFLEAYNKMILGNHVNFKFGDLKWRCHTAVWAAGQALNIEGDFIELGVNTGIFSRTICEYYQFQNINKKFYLYDTFEGVPSSENYTLTKGDIKRNNSYIGTYEAAKSNFKDFSNVYLVKGMLPSTIDLNTISKISYICVDLNNAFYEMQCIKLLWDKISIGGVILLDDYAFAGFEEQYKVWNDFAESKSLSILTLAHGQGILIKN